MVRGAQTYSQCTYEEIDEIVREQYQAWDIYFLRTAIGACQEYHACNTSDFPAFPSARC